MAKPKPPGRGIGDPSSGPGQQDIDADETADEPGTEDARGDAEKLKRNRERLDVNAEHKTPDMEKKHRGTFP